MIDITFQPAQLVIDQINSLSVKLTNSGDKACTHVNFRLRLPSQIVLLEGTDKIENAKVDPGQNIILAVRVRPKQVGVWVISSSSFSYRDYQGQPYHPTPLQQEITVIPMVSAVKSQPAYGSNSLIAGDRTTVRDPNALNHSILSPEDITYPPKTIRPLSTNEYENEVFVSYAWGDEREEIVDQIDQALQERGLKIVRDRRDLEYRGSIKEFMERIGRGDCVIVVISDKYLRSPNCMFELVEIAENKDFQNRVFPVIWHDANIYDPLKRIDYIKYWEVKRNELAKAIKKLDPANLQGIREEMDLYDRIRDKVSGLTSILKDMNALTPEMHQETNFSQLYDSIEKGMKRGKT